jgi:biopolymer transport protein ExbD
MLEEFGILRRKERSAEVSIAPLLDMVFILLIFFVITTNFNRQTGIDIQKPQAQSAVFTAQRTIMVGVSREGAIHIHGQQVSMQRLEGILKQELARHPEASVVIVGDRQSPLGRSVEVMDACLLAGISKVSVAAEKK